MIKKNCWEIKKCGREPDGSKVHEMGVCPASTDVSSDGINCGKNAGRFCWAVVGTFCDGDVQGTAEEKRMFCMNCKVYKTVLEEEQGSFKLAKSRSKAA